MDVCLITPPSPFLLDDHSLPWLGPLYVAASLRERGHRVRILDLTGHPDYRSVTKKDARENGADVYGLSATSPDYHLAVEIRDAIREVTPNQRVILGGAHATAAHAHCHGWDAIVSGDGFLASERALTESGVVSASKKGEVIEDLDTIPFAARDLVDLESYDFRVVGEKATSVMSSWSCPMGCTFCSMREVYSYRKLRMMSPARIIAEWDAIRRDYPSFRAIQDFSDEWNIPASRAIELSEALVSHPVKWAIRCFCKAELFSEDVAKAMAKAGVVEILVGVESGSDRILKLIKKNTTWEINGRARENAKKYGIRFKAATMVGLPTETREDALKTKEWLLTFKPDDLDVTILTPLPGSPIYEHPETEGKGLFFDKGDGEILPYKTVPGEYRAKTRTETLSNEDLVRLRDEIDRDVRQALGIKPVERVNLYDHSVGQQAFS